LFKVRLKASIPYVQTNSHWLYNILHFVVFTAISIHLKKPSVARRANRSPMPWGDKFMTILLKERDFFSAELYYTMTRRFQ
jgi:hypothetical protein